MKLNVHQIRKILPHRYPFLLVDRVENIEFGQRIHAIKNVTVNEPFFPGHFPEYPVFPGVLIMEALAQAAAILTFASASEEETLQAADDLYLFAGIDNARFKRPVMPGDRLELFAEMTASKRGIYKYKAVAKVDGQVVAEADLMCAHRKMGDA
ncbi:MAG: 3-hydroxyacyl-ACP dehydratase FabZ [Fluviibacter sp.]|jgi:3-hydroxyacyl-[acyl-carrier-protein] dehydratase